MDISQYATAFASKDDVVAIGNLSLPTGWIVACDPFFSANALPFMQTVAPGNYTVELRLTFSPQAGRRVALARIVFQPGARAASLVQAQTGSPQPGGYLVDSGLGAFMDEKARKLFTRMQTAFYREHPDGNYYTDVIESQMKAQSTNPHDPGVRSDWAIFPLESSGLNVVIFSTGVGDGSYASFWGLDDHSKPISLVTDFQIL